MAGICSICHHPDRQAIDEGILAGTAYRTLKEQYGISLAAINRHRASHLPERLVKAVEAAEVASADTLLDQVRDLQTRALRILEQAEASGDLRTAIAAIREARGNLELLARMLGELQESQTVNILVAPQWISLRTVILDALQPYPDARLQLAEVLDAELSE